MRSNIIGTMRHAAQLLELHAARMRYRDCNVLDDDGWHPDDVLVEIEHGEMMAVAGVLSQHAAAIESIEDSIPEGVANGNTTGD